MKLSKIKAMLLTLLTLGTAGMAQMVNYCQIDPYTVSGGFTYTRCEDGKTSDIIMYFYSWPTFLDDGFKFDDRFQTAVKTNRRIILDFFGVDDSTTFYLYNRKIDYGYFKKIEGKPCQSTLLWRDTLQWSGYGNIENHTLAYHKSRSEIVSAVREAGFRKYRVAIWKYEYLSTDLNKWNSPPDYDGSYYTHDDLLFDDYKDFVPIFGSVSWYVSSYIHDGVETTYTADDYPKAYDFIRSKDNILLKIPVNPNGDTTKGVLQYNDGSEWRTDPDYQEDVFKKEKNVTLRFNGTSTGGDHLERLMNKSTGQALIRYRMYKEGATDTLYTPEIKLNIQYLVNWGSTNNVNRGKEWVQGFEDREGKINVAAGVVDYGKTAVLVAEPKDGFDFECWKNESGDCVANAATYNENGVKRFKTNITVKSDTTLSASYIPLYKIFYYDSDGNTRLDESAYVKKGESVSAPANKPTRDGYTFYGWYVTYDPGVMKNPENYPQYKFDFTKAVSDEVYCSAISGCNETFDRFVTLYAAYTVNKHNVVYKVDGEVYKTVENVAYGTDLKTIAAPTASTKTGYTFSGWSTLPATMPDEDVVVTGTFTVNKHYVVYKVDDDPYAVVLNVPYGKDLRVTDEESYVICYIDGEPCSGDEQTLASIVDPQKTGHTFSGWSALPATMPDEDVFVTGTFTVNKHNVVYKVDDEVYETVENVAYGTDLTTVTAPDAPTKTGYTFSGWSALPATMPDEDVVVTGTFTIKTFSVAWVVEEKTVETDENVEYGSKPSYDGATPTKAADEKYTYTFSDWMADVEGWNAESVVTSNMTFTAQFDKTEIPSSGKSSSSVAKSSSSTAKSSSSVAKSSSSTAKSSSSVAKSSSSTAKSSASVAKSSSSTAKSSASKDKSSSSTGKSSSSGKDAIAGGMAIPQLSITVVDHNLQIAGARVGSTYSLMDMQGRVIYKGRVQSANFTVAVPVAANYIISVAGSAQLVNVK